MIETAITRAFGLATPIVNAGMAMIARPPLTAAVSNAGGLGTLGCDISPPERLREMIRETRAMTDGPFGVDLIGDFVTDAHLDVLIEEAVPLAIFFWTLPTAAQVARLRAASVAVWMQVGSVAEAKAAHALGFDALIVQGAEAGGHTRAEASTMTLFPRVRAMLPDTPLLASGGIADGRTMAAALVLGADSVWCGTRFLAARKSAAHDDYLSRVIAADVGDTAVLTAYGPEWPDQPMRVILNDSARAALGNEDRALAEAAGDTAGTVERDGARVPIPAYSAILPTRDFEGDIEKTCLTAGQSTGNIAEILPAAEIVRRMTEEAEAALRRVGLPAMKAA